MSATQVKKLMKKSEYAGVCGVSATAITKAVRTVLAPAFDGKRIDAAHPVAVKYFEKHTAGSAIQPATGIDPLYEQALKLCQDTGRFSKSNIARGLNIGFARAGKIFTMIEAAGGKNLPNAATTAATPPPPPGKKTPPPPPPAVTGHTAKNNSKKSAALAKLNDKLENGTTLHEIPEDILAFVDMTLRELLLRFGTETAFKDFLSATKQIEDINEKRLKNAATRGEVVSRTMVRTGIVEPIDTAFNNMLTDGSKTMSIRITAMVNAGKDAAEVEDYIKKTLSSFIRPTKAKVARSMGQL